jgi:hypothetical protein
LGVPGSESGRNKRYCLLQNIRTYSGTHPASYSMGTEVLCRGIKRPGRGVSSSPPSPVIYAFMAWIRRTTLQVVVTLFVRYMALSYSHNICIFLSIRDFLLDSVFTYYDIHYYPFFLSLTSYLPTHGKCRGLLLHLIKFSDTNTQSVGLSGRVIGPS